MKGSPKRAPDVSVILAPGSSRRRRDDDGQRRDRRDGGRRGRGGDGESRDSTPYAATKLFGERLGRCYAESRGLSVVAVRIGWVWRGDNRPSDLPPDREAWFRQMWLSNRDYRRLMERCIAAELSERFVVVNAMSANSAMRWDIDTTRRLVGYEPLDDVTRSA